MTVIVGLVCKDGLVLAADTQESDEEDGMKRLDVKKIYDSDRFDLEDIEIAVAGTGTSAHISRAAELINELGFNPRLTTPRSVADVAEDALGKMKERYCEKDAELELQLLVGAYCKVQLTGDPPPPQLGLYSVYPPAEGEKVGVAEAVTDYACLGTGGLFARYLLNRLHDEHHPVSGLSMDAAIHEAVYVISEVIKVDLWCGGDIQLVCIQDNGKLEWAKADDIKQMLASLARTSGQGHQEAAARHDCNDAANHFGEVSLDWFHVGSNSAEARRCTGLGEFH